MIYNIFVFISLIILTVFVCYWFMIKIKKTFINLLFFISFLLITFFGSPLLFDLIPVYMIALYDTTEKDVNYFKPVTKTTELNSLSYFEKKYQLFQKICDKNVNCSKFQFSEIKDICANNDYKIKEINILPLYPYIQDSYPSLGLDLDSKEITPQHVLNYFYLLIHKNDSPMEKYSIIQVTSYKNLQPLYYKSAFVMNSEYGINITFNNNETFISGQKTDILKLDKKEIIPFLNQTISQSCQYYSKQNEIINDWKESEIK